MGRKRLSEEERAESKRRKLEYDRMHRQSEEVKAADRERKRQACSTPEARERRNAQLLQKRQLKRRKRELKHQKQAVKRQKRELECESPEFDLNNYSDQTNWLKVEERFFKSIADGPTHRCYCCDRLWMKKNLKSLSKADLRSLGFTEQNISIIFSVDHHDEAEFCKTCYDHIRKKTIPPLAANYGFRYPDLPFCLSSLNSLEERLVALRIPFMQIRELGRDRQFGIRGSITNVPNDLHKTVDYLPHNINDSVTVYIKLKKRLSQK